MKLIKPTFVSYSNATCEITICFADGSKSSWPVKLLEMVRYDGFEWVNINPTDEQLSKVELWGEDSIQWDEIDQAFRIEDLMNRIYGRKEWMEKLAVSSMT